MSQAPEVKGQNVNLLESLFKRRDEEREKVKNAPKVVSGDDIAWERNRMGWLRWYIHPDMENVATRALLFWIQELPPGGRSGMQLHQGGRVHVIWEGKGYTTVDGVRHNWETGDVVLLPVKPEGTMHQHFNLDPDKPARLVVVEANLYDALGVDLGSGFEQVAEAPEDPEGYQPRMES